MDDDVTTFAEAPRQRILGARFQPIQHRLAAMSVSVFAENLHIGGAQLFARIGNQPVTFIVPIQGGRGFTGTLRQMPHEGDRLFVRYLGGLEHSTDIVYRSSAGGGPANRNVA